MAKVDVKALGLSLGIVWGLAMFLLGLMNIFLNWGGALEEIMSSLYIGYGPTFIGSVIGGVWGFFDAGIGGLVIGLLYNKLAK